MSADNEPKAFPVVTPPRYCLRCPARLPHGVEYCPRCGLQFDPHNPATYAAAPPFLWWKYWLPGFCIAVVASVINYAFIMLTGEMGYALFLGVPVSLGMVLGYSVRVGLALLVLLGVWAIGSVIASLITLELAGVFCGATLALIFFVPVIVGILLGLALRDYLKRSRWSQRAYLPLLLIALFPVGAELIENQFPSPDEVVTVPTELTIDATPEEVWRAITMYEDVQHPHPWLLDLALPKPIRSEGRKDQVGNVVRCVYDSGRLCKQITAVEPGRRLAFDIVEQVTGAERYVRLGGGSFEIVPDGENRSKVILHTRYERWLRPDWIWEPIEQEVIHSLHGHVLEGMRLKAKQQQEENEQYPPKKPPGLAAVRPH